MPNGTVKFFNAAKGFGFITSDESTKDIFVPATSITAAGVASLKAGQLVSFQIVPDTKGPKAVDLKIIGPAPAPVPKQAPPPAKSASRLTLYVDSSATVADEVLAELRREGQEPLVVDYMAAPPSKEDLKKLSLMLREGDQSAVKKYEPLFHALRLDDRFISDGEYWEAIFEHPALINGPIVATAFKARLCHSKAAVKAFLSLSDSEGSQAPKRKTLSPGLLRLMSGNAAPPPPLPKSAPVEKPQPKAEVAPVKKIKLEAKARPVAKVASAKPKVAAKPKPAPKAPARKPAKKTVVKSKKR